MQRHRVIFQYTESSWNCMSASSERWDVAELAILVIRRADPLTLEYVRRWAGWWKWHIWYSMRKNLRGKMALRRYLQDGPRAVTWHVAELKENAPSSPPYQQNMEQHEQFETCGGMRRRIAFLCNQFPKMPMYKERMQGKFHFEIWRG